MKETLIHAFLLELRTQAAFALLAGRDLDAALSSCDLDRLWMAVQTILACAGHVSMILWPVRATERGRYLRGRLSVVEDSPLCSRLFRNHFEHFDERLETWASSAGKLIDHNVGPTRMISGGSSDDYLRNFDTEKFSVSFRGDRYELQPVLGAMSDLWEKAEAELRRFYARRNAHESPLPG